MSGSIPAHVDLVTGVHSLLATSLIGLCWLTVRARSCLVHPGALPSISHERWLFYASDT